jgi:hypothetical protein
MPSLPKKTALYALIVAILVSIYVYSFGLFQEKGILIEAFSGRTIAAVTIAMLSHVITTQIQNSNNTVK